MQLSACSCARLIEIYDHVQVPLTFQYELWKIDLLYGKEKWYQLILIELHFLSEYHIFSVFSY